MKFLLLSNELPPFWSGQALVLERILRALPVASYVIGTYRDFESVDPQCTFKLPSTYRRLPLEQVLRGAQGRIGNLLYARRPQWIYKFAMQRRAKRIAQLIEEEKCAAVVACTDYVIDFPAALRACQITGAKLFLYVFDDYLYKWRAGAESTFAARCEPEAMRGATSIIVPNDFMRDALYARYGLRATIIYNPFDANLYPVDNLRHSNDHIKPHTASDTGKSQQVVVLYTGAVYEAHYDAFRNLLEALTQLYANREADAQLHLYTSYGIQELIEQGLNKRVTFHPHLTPAAMPAVQQAADILFLPLAFNSPYPEVVRTSAPGKFGELLAAGRPLLVHAPADSFVAWYCRKYDCGVVVDKEDVAQLAKAVKRLLDDEELRSRITRHARARAAADFSTLAARTVFAQLLGVSIQK